MSINLRVRIKRTLKGIWRFFRLWMRLKHGNRCIYCGSKNLTSRTEGEYNLLTKHQKCLDCGAVFPKKTYTRPPNWP